MPPPTHPGPPQKKSINFSINQVIKTEDSSMNFSVENENIFIELGTTFSTLLFKKIFYL